MTLQAYFRKPELFQCLFLPTEGSPHVRLNLDRILVVPDDIDNCPDIFELAKPILKAIRAEMNMGER